MTDKVEITVFNDKSYVRFSEYQKVKEENEKLKQQNEQLKAQNLKMRRCVICKHFNEYNKGTDNYYYTCELEECNNLDKWELA